MAECCPPGRGCNSPKGDEPCALELCSIEKHEPDAALALSRWEELQRIASDRHSQRRFRRRAYERARDRALRALAMRIRPWMLRNLRGPADGGRVRQPKPPRRRAERRPAS